MSIAKGTTIFVYSLDSKLFKTFFSAKARRACEPRPAAAKFFNCADTTIMRNIRSGKIFRGESKTYTMYVLLTYIYTYICRFFH
jgi:hypothetical protein